MTNPSETRDSELVARLRSEAENARVGFDAGAEESIIPLLKRAADTIDRLTSSGEAVAWMHPSGAWVDHRYKEVAMHCGKDGPQPVPLYTHASPREGHVEVPMEPVEPGVREAFTALDLADSLIERAYGLDVPREWNMAYRKVAKARAARNQGETKP